ncbi:zwei Ig domain protein zig-8-like, partial [Vespula squamosa]
ILRNSISLHAYDSYFGIAIKGKHQIDISVSELAKARTEGLNVVVFQLTIRPRSSSNPDCYLPFNDIFKIPTKPFCPLDRAVYAITLFTKKPSSLNALQTITWLRRKDRQLLTLGTNRHSVDTRFAVRHTNTDWALQIQMVNLGDEGIYECQVTSHPIQRSFTRLKITEAYSIIPGAPDLHVKQGSSLRLECQLMAATELPQYVFWYRQGRMINYDAEPGVKVELTKSGSILMVNKTKPTHGGNYTCKASNAKPAYVMVHVIEEILGKSVSNLKTCLPSRNSQERFPCLLEVSPVISVSQRERGGETSSHARWRQEEPQSSNFGEQLSGFPTCGRQLEDTEFHEPLPNVNHRLGSFAGWNTGTNSFRGDGHTRRPIRTTSLGYVLLLNF